MKAVVLALFPLVLAAPDAAQEPLRLEPNRLLEGPGLVIEHAGEELRLARNGAGRAELVHEPVPSVVVAAVGAEEALM
jgi:hypothetical protein